MKEFIIKDCEKKYNEAQGIDKLEWLDRWAEMLRYRDENKRRIEEMLIKNFGFRKGKDTLTLK